MPNDTIFALASGRPPAGIAILRISGPAAPEALARLAGALPPPRLARRVRLADPATGEMIDDGLALFFPAPASFTGEDVVELHLHGGRAVVAAALAALAVLPGLRLAEPGEFTRRAFESGRIDLTEAEGLADLIGAETEAQRRQALRGATGGLARLAEGWRDRLIEARALIEAELDFSDEADVDSGAVAAAREMLAGLQRDVLQALAGAERGERLREGFRVALMGRPNAGKSSLLNALADRDVAIVSDIAGTTRDAIAVHLDLRGYPVTVVDTAGLRATSDAIEGLGIDRARAEGAAADLVLWLADDGTPPPDDLGASDVARVATKADLGRRGGAGAITVSVRDPASVGRLVDELARRAEAALGGEPALVTQERQRQAVSVLAGELSAAVAAPAPEVAAEHARAASVAVGRLSGRIDVEDVLGAIFSRFCIGK